MNNKQKAKCFDIIQEIVNGHSASIAINKTEITVAIFPGMDHTHIEYTPETLDEALRKAVRFLEGRQGAVKL